jgi:hypothetical protein
MRNRPIRRTADDASDFNCKHKCCVTRASSGDFGKPWLIYTRFRGSHLITYSITVYIYEPYMNRKQLELPLTLICDSEQE